MRHLILSLVLILYPFTSGAFEIEEQVLFGPENSARMIRVISTGDVRVFEPMITGFLAENTDVAVDYTVVSSSELMKAISQEEASFDVAISSAMDLQTKLANDGFTAPYSSQATEALPEWARWRQDLFAFTQEPATIVLSKEAFAGLPLPQTRQDLISILRQHPDKFRGKIGTYDLRQSGLGYLFATQDSRTSEVYWRLTEVMGALDAQLYCCSSDMINDVSTGKLAVAYNVLGNYALSRADTDRFIVLLPSDFTTVMMRTVLIPRNAQNKELAEPFVDYLLQVAWNNAGQPSKQLYNSIMTLAQKEDSLRRIRLGPGLLIFLDTYKKRSFLTAWENAILQE
ncbi:MAG: ABC transporter substrate-binding protein [Rhodobacteraceae bacterium]|nr:ABC transporter substrate-binding protein [Paracoccaceae bacterium]